MDELNELKARMEELEANHQKLAAEAMQDLKEINRKAEKNAYYTKKSMEAINEKARKARNMANVTLMISLFSLLMSALALVGII